ncbi:hypothetical protein CS0771_42960 [Catellatospora sp. IY07-71]|uniref:hypothetical protein n=1 Tax=Catellatospora sp. IY07-71 TaxID=2728827 RepID=UPI001BB3305A|nr:hypothetical protein [Catellatospora sp. IY07-71]BCJ74752.1 hypothetical protein CS0771_42960 [Catellatospora sp. IY07-71]
MPHHPRRTAFLLLPAALLAGVLAACKDSGTPSAAPSAVTVVSPSAAGSPSAAASPAAASPSPKAPVNKVPTCAQVKEAMIRGSIDPYDAFGADGAPLTEGIFSGEDGLVLAVQQACTTGDLGGKLGKVTVGTIMSSYVDTTGRWWGVMLCVKPGSRAQCTVHFALNDRDPIESVSIAGHKLTVVYLTRPDDAGSATVAVRRTAVYGVSGSTLTELSHTDAPYTP